VRNGTLERVLAAFAEGLNQRGGLDLSECFIDGTFVGARRGRGIGKTKRGKGTRLTASADSSDLRVSLCAAECVTPREVSLLGETLEASFVEEKPERPIGDRGHDSDPLDAWLEAEDRCCVINRANGAWQMPRSMAARPAVGFRPQ